MPMIGGSTSRFRARMAQRVLLLVGALLFLGGLFWLFLPFFPFHQWLGIQYWDSGLSMAYTQPMVPSAGIVPR